MPSLKQIYTLNGKYFGNYNVTIFGQNINLDFTIEVDKEKSTMDIIITGDFEKNCEEKYSLKDNEINIIGFDTNQDNCSRKTFKENDITLNYTVYNSEKDIIMIQISYSSGIISRKLPIVNVYKVRNKILKTN